VAKVLVVDDSLSVRKAVERMLAPRGLAVASCASGNEALARLPAEAPDLLICDLLLPDLDGYEVCRWLRQVPALAATPVLFISGIVDADVESRVAALAVEGVLKKPFTGEDLVGTVERILAARRDAPRSVAATPPPAAPMDSTAPAVAPAAAPRAADSAATAASSGGPRIRALLSEVTTLAGFRCVLLLSPGPRTLVLAGELAPAAGDPSAAPLSAWLAAAAAVAAQLELGEPDSAVLEATSGTLLARRIDSRVTLILVLASSTALGKARLYTARLQRVLLAALAAAPGAGAD
jgi:CheY-like chemotaxis protein